MIDRQEILEFAGGVGLDANVVEKDYVLGWMLAGISQHPRTSETWLFKGGTCLKKVLTDPDPPFNTEGKRWRIVDSTNLRFSQHRPMFRLSHGPGGGPNRCSSQNVISASGRMIAKNASCLFSKGAPRVRSSQRSAASEIAYRPMATTVK